MVVGTTAGKADERLVLSSKTADDATNFDLRLLGRNIEFALQLQFLRNLGIEVVKALDTNDIQHLLNVIGRMGEIFVHNYSQIAS